MRNKFLTSAALFLLLGVSGPARAAEPDAGLTLWYQKPAGPKSGMNEALPIGNGRIGGLIFGGVDSDRIALNEDSLWTGTDNPSGGYDTKVKFGSYQTLGDLVIELPGHDKPAAYRRELNLANAIAADTHQADAVEYRREYFCSHPDEVLVVHLTASKPGSCTGSVQLVDSHKSPSHVSADRIQFEGALNNGLKYETQVQIKHDGGTITATSDRLEFKGCDSITLLVAAGTDYAMDFAKGYRGEAPHERIDQQLKAASAKPYDLLKSAHIQDYQSLFNRVSLHLGNSPADRLSKPIPDRKVADSANGGDPELEALLFQYGRYLMIGSSRPGGLPANLQGLWNESNSPAWASDYHANINVQMCYWPAEVANLGECHLPLFDLIRSQLPAWRKATAAEKAYRLDSGPVRGWAIRTSHNIFGGLGWNWDKTANAWYCQHLWEHFAFGRDKEYLKTVAYPLLKETTEFWDDHLKTLPDGRLVVPNGWSPEHGPTEDGVSYNQQIVWDLFTNYIEASEALDVDSAYRAKISAMRDKLVGPKIGKWGQLQEWMTDRDDPKDHHRHTSNLFAVYPGRQVSIARTPELAEAARKSLEARSDTGDVREWSFAWRTSLRARLHDPEAAYRMVRQFLSDRNSCANLFGLHPPMQMDGDFGITAGIAEMLLQSHEGEINLLPALPKAWPTGSVTGLRARGGFEVDESWKDGELTTATVEAKVGGVCRVRAGVAIKVTSDGKPVDVKSTDKNVVEFLAAKDHRYEISR